MKKSLLVGNLSDWINELDVPVTLTPMKALELQDLLILCRRELSRQDVAPEESETSKQVKAAIQQRMQKLKLKE